MKPYLSALQVVLVCLMAVGCGPKPDAATPTPAQAPDASTITLGVIPKSTGGEFWETVETGREGRRRNLALKSSGREPSPRPRSPSRTRSSRT